MTRFNITKNWLKLAYFYYKNPPLIQVADFLINSLIFLISKSASLVIGLIFLLKSRG